VDDGSLRPGDRLPSERELSERFRVGRSAVRDAIRVLEVKGVVKPRQGKGTVVQALSPDSLVAVLAGAIIRKRGLVAELMDLRAILEPPLAARAARNASPAQVARLEEILRRQGARVRRGESAVEEDLEFHGLIASAAGNGVLLAVLDTLINLLSETRRRSLQVKGRARASLAGHQRVLRAIAARAPAVAEAAMRRHIEAVEAMIRKQTA